MPVIARHSTRHLISTIAIVLFCFTTVPAFCADQKPDLNFSAFRALLKDAAAHKQSGAGDVFMRLLAAQERVAAARESLDRLTGWYKAAVSRLQAQNAPAADVELLHFAQAKAAARVAGFESERLAIVEEANALLKRAAASPLVAILDVQAAPPTPDKKPDAATPAEPLPEPAPDIASRRAIYEKDLLPSGKQLLNKMYQSYLFGGVPLTALLWQEHEVFETDLQYRLLLVEQERRTQPK